MRVLLRLAQLELVRLNREIHCERAPLTSDAGDIPPLAVLFSPL